MTRGPDWDAETIERSKEHAARALAICDPTRQDDHVALKDLLTDLMHYFHATVHPDADGETPLDGDDWVYGVLDEAHNVWSEERDS